MLIDTLLVAFGDLLSLSHLAFLLLGVLIGMAIGIFPGLGGVTGLALLMPFIYGMDSVSAMAMIIGLVAVTTTADTFTSVLAGIPGTSSSQATILDGFPLAKSGQATRALSAAFLSSLVGGVLGACVLTISIVLARPVLLSFGSAELFMLALFGLSMVCTIAGRSMLKGLAAGSFGLIVGSVGAAPATGETRLVFGIDYLYDGVPLAVVGLGLFAIPEIVNLLRNDQPIATGGRLSSGWMQGVLDWWRNKYLSLRCAIIGCFVGAIPGLGGSVVDWIAYSHAVQSTKGKNTYGQGDIRGVIAPESANNAKTGGALLPTLLFGIPGSPQMGIFLAGMVLVGVQPGPSMVGVNLHLTYTIVWSLALANVIGAGLCILLSSPIARLTTIPFQFLAPFMIAVITFAAFRSTLSFIDLTAFLIVGTLGIFMKRFGWSRPAFLIGFVLAPQTETYFYQSIQFYGVDFLARPGVVIIALIMAVTVFLGFRNRVDENHGLASGFTSEMGGRRIITRLPQIAMTLSVLAVFVVSLIYSRNITFLGSIFPTVVCCLGIAVSFGILINYVFVSNENPALFDQEIKNKEYEKRSISSQLYWFAIIVFLTGIFGFYLSLIVFFYSYCRFRASMSAVGSVIMTMGIAGFILILGRALNLNFPPGLLQSVVDLPWPFR